MENKKISVIIPTCDRPQELKECLRALSIQNYPLEYVQVIVVDDGKFKKSRLICMQNFSGLKIDYVPKNHSGPAAARNIGIEKASGDIILFLGDDIIAEKNLLYEHNRLHSLKNSDNAGFLGYVKWDSRLNITPFMRWLEESGVQFDYGSLIDGRKTDFRHFYTCNVSIKSSFLRKNNIFFNEQFPSAAYEDTEFAFRLEKAGFELYYSRQASAAHFHKISAKGYAARMFNVGKSALLLEKLTGIKRGDSFGLLKLLWKGFKAFTYFILASLIEKHFYSEKIFAGLVENFHALGYFFAGRRR